MSKNEWKKEGRKEKIHLKKKIVTNIKNKEKERKKEKNEYQSNKKYL